MKKISILGKILLIALLPIYLLAGSVSATIDKTAIYPGDSVTLTLSATGSDIEFPKIDKIDNYPVADSGTSTSIVIMNGDMKKTLKRSYSFSPDKNVTIPSFTVKVGGKEYKTQPINVSILDPKTAIKNGADASLQMVVDKNSSYVGEALNLDLILKLKANSNIAKAQIEPPKFSNLWAKQVGDVQKSQEGNYIVQKYHFIVFPQQSGKITIPPIVAHIAKAQKDAYDPFFGSGMNISMFGGNLEWSKVFSNPVTINVKPLPDNLELYGDFNIKATPDRTKVYAGKAVNLTVTVEGVGNIDDVKKFNFDIPNAVVYADEPKVQSGFRGKEYGGRFTQKIAIVGDSNFTIPALELRYFDKNSKKEVVKKTQPINITVIGGAKVTNVQQTAPKIVTAPNSSDMNNSSHSNNNANNSTKIGWLLYVYLLISFIAGLLVMWLIKSRKPKEKKELPIVKKIQKAKSDKDLHKVLLPFAKDSKVVSNELKKLEDNIYNDGKNEVNKDALLDYFEDLEESIID